MSIVPERKRKFLSELPSEVTNFQWKIDNFKAMVDLVEPLKSAQLKFDAGQSIKLPTTWRFCFGTKEVANGKLGMFLQLLDSPKDYNEVYVMYEVLIKNSNGTDFKRLFLKTTDMKKEKTGWGFPDALGPLSQISSNVLVNGSLIMDMKFEMFSFGKTNSSVINVEDHARDKIARFQEKSRNVIINGLQKLVDHRNYCPSDFKIITKDGKAFPVHKTILGSRSPVFLAMFKSKMEEASSGILQVNDLSAEAMDITLRFIYTGNVTGNWKKCVEEILHAAEKYSLTLLKEFCDTMLLDAVTPENAFELLNLARKFKLETAEKELDEYTSENIKKILNVTILT